jgi:hypothetical protein
VIRGAHTLKFGVVAIRHCFNGFSAFPTRGAFDFNGQFTRQIGSLSLMLDVAYLGTRGDRLLINSVNLNQAVPGSAPTAQRRPYYTINPNLVNIAYLTGWGQSKYQSLQVHLEQRLSSGLTFGASYTYSAYLSDAGNPNGGGNSDYQNDQCVACNWGPTPDDHKPVLSFNHAYELPFGVGRKFVNHRPLGYALAGWDLNGIWSAYSGGRFTAILGTNVSNQSGGEDQRPNRIGRGSAFRTTKHQSLVQHQ